MKYVVLVPDGAGDYPLKELNGKTPLQAAKTPNMDFLARNGVTGIVRTIPHGMDPGSDVANLSLLGYDPVKYYTGRGPLEAASRGIPLREDEMAFRCNLVTADAVLEDYSAGHISTEEAKILIESIDNELAGVGIHFYSGVSYRHLVVIKGDFSSARCVPPHDIVGQSIEENMPHGPGADILRELMMASREILEDHPINEKRKRLGKNPANMIWLWGQGKAPSMPTFVHKFGIRGCVISAVDLIKGIANYAGLKAIEVPGATGYFDTDYLAKAEYALEALKEDDFVFVHVEAPDEAGHARNIEIKIKTIEDFDAKLVGTILKDLKNYGDHKILLATDHLTPIAVGTHVADPVPFAIYSATDQRDEMDQFYEFPVRKSSLYINEGHRLMNLFIGGGVI
ncbi:MAG: cofactor-independent phosphoglycerate mutase [Actinomycetota bacterium]|nr:cofactor-independent phosphoglycerate mutase [Actinomycetota bacterium]